MKLYTQFIKEISEGKVPACKWTKLAVKRHQSDMEDKDSPWYFDTKEADRYIQFIQLFRLVEGTLAGANIPLQPFQAFIVASLFGWKHRKTKHRRYTDSYIQVPKKNAKSTLVAAIISAMFFLEKEGLGQYLYAATSRKQAGICYRISKLMIKKFIAEFDMKEMVSVTVPSIQHNGTNAFITAVSKEADSVEGMHASAASLDEYHIHKTDEVVNNIKSGMGGREQPLLLRITTPGTNLGSPCFTFYEYCCDILEGKKKDDRLFSIIFGLDDGDDPFEEINWAKANPNIGASPTWEFIRSQAQQALNMGGAKRSDFLTKHVGVWVSNASAWIKDELIKRVYDRDLDIAGKYGGFCAIDLAYSNDLTAFCMVFDDLTYAWRFFIPESKLHDNEDGVDYQKWVEEGHIIVTYAHDGNMTDYEIVKQYVLQDMEKYGMRKLYYDPWNSNQFIIDISDKHGIKTGKYGQSPTNVSPVLQLLEDEIIQGKMTFGNPVARWMFGNVNIEDKGNGVRTVKKRMGKANKIDGIVAMIMARAALMIEGKVKKKPRIILLNQNNNNNATDTSTTT
jgi:phage terminase large subunit-like protein